MIFKEAFDWVWDKVPWYCKWPVVIVSTPTFLILTFLQWHTNSVHAIVKPIDRVREEQIKSIDKQLQSIDDKLDILIEASTK